MMESFLSQIREMTTTTEPFGPQVQALGHLATA